MWDRVNGNLWDELTDNICGSEPVVGVPSLAPIDSHSSLACWPGAPLGPTPPAERAVHWWGGGHPWSGWLTAGGQRGVTALGSQASNSPGLDLCCLCHTHLHGGVHWGKIILFNTRTRLNLTRYSMVTVNYFKVSFDNIYIQVQNPWVKV